MSKERELDTKHNRKLIKQEDKSTELITHYNQEPNQTEQFIQRNQYQLQLLQVLEYHEQVCAIQWNHDSTIIAVGGFDSTIQLWKYDLNSKWYRYQVLGEKSNFTDWKMDFSHNSNLLVSGNGRKVSCWQQQGGYYKINQTIQLIEPIYSLSFNKPSTSIAFTSCFGHISFISLSSGKQKLQYKLRLGSNLYKVEINNDHTMIIAVTNHHQLMMCQKNNNQQWNQYILDGHSCEVKSIRINSESNKFVSVSKDRTVKLWQQDINKQWICQSTLTKHGLDIYDIAFSHDSTLLVTCSTDQTIRVWDLSTLHWECFQVFKAHLFGQIIFNHDSTILAAREFLNVHIFLYSCTY